MAIFGLALSPIGLWLAPKIPNAPLQILFSLILLYVAIRLLHQARNEIKGVPEEHRKPPPCLMNPAIGKLQWTMPCARALMLAGSLAGFLSGLLGVGGGFIIVPALKRYTDLPVKSIVATSLGVLAIITSGGTIFSAASGSLNIIVAAPFALAIRRAVDGSALREKDKWSIHSTDFLHLHTSDCYWPTNQRHVNFKYLKRSSG